MEQALFAVDELSGFIRAVALARPGKSLDGLTPRSVRRKLRDKNFAKDVNWEGIRQGAAELGVELDEHISFIVESMQPLPGDKAMADGSSPVRHSLIARERGWRDRNVPAVIIEATLRVASTGVARGDKLIRVAFPSPAKAAVGQAQTPAPPPATHWAGIGAGGLARVGA